LSVIGQKNSEDDHVSASGISVLRNDSIKDGGPDLSCWIMLEKIIYFQVILKRISTGFRQNDKD
jgi:hypothetical protein